MTEVRIYLTTSAVRFFGINGTVECVPTVMDNQLLIEFQTSEKIFEDRAPRKQSPLAT